MKVLTATVLAWLLHKVGNALFRAGYHMEMWGCDVENWAGLLTFGDEYKAGGTD